MEEKVSRGGVACCEDEVFRAVLLIELSARGPWVVCQSRRGVLYGVVNVQHAVKSGGVVVSVSWRLGVCEVGCVVGVLFSW
jgi:hypothetical protein